jgi:hypothetical protein
LDLVLYLRWIDFAGGTVVNHMKVDRDHNLRPAGGKCSIPLAELAYFLLNLFGLGTARSFGAAREPAIDHKLSLVPERPVVEFELLFFLRSNIGDLRRRQFLKEADNNEHRA